MAESRAFDVGDVLSVTTGRLVSRRHMDGIYDVCQFMVSEPVWTHQLPRVCDEVRSTILSQHPWLADVEVPDTIVDQESCNAWLDTLPIAHVDLVPLDVVDHTSIDPISELKMMRPEATVVVVATDTDPPSVT